MIRIGLMDLDTGHALAFTKRLNDMADVKVTAVFDHGDVRDASEIAAFADMFDCQVAESIQHLAGMVDGVMVLGVDWNKRFERAAQLIKRNVPVFMCKPTVGSVADVESLIALQQQTGSLVMTGSGWRWCLPTQQAASTINISNLTHFAVHAPMPRFYYGVHGWEFLAGLLGAGVQWIEPVQITEKSAHFTCAHISGVVGDVYVGSDRARVIQWADDKGEHELELDIPSIQLGFCQTFVDMIKTGKMPAPIASQLMPVRCGILAEQSCELGRRVMAGELDQNRIVTTTQFMQTYHARPLLPQAV
ncbi:MAG: Gfo/Idh/MocA family oxidoreductase [Phycisphaeraceae bacterium JB051]